ncbi:MAG: hypothetical protein JWQ83_505, partial [Lacunisphaera sp.]|nr:hypothetical protein [Lacunisphaera sp.]
MLVVLCLLAVLGIALASYLSISNQSMKLSNRSYTIDVSRHLAEMGLEEAMRAFNNNNWATWTGGGTTATWSVSGTTASCTINFPSTEYGGSGVTGSVKIRVDNYNAYFQSSTWNSSTGYQVNDLVGNSGAWYRAVQSNINQTTPGNLAYWVQAPIPWTWSNNITYSQYDVVNYNGTWYRCHTSCTNITPTNTLNWVSIPALALSWNSGTNYSFGSIVYDSGAWYYCIKRTGSASNATTNTSYWAPVVTSTGADAAVGASTYVVGDQFYYGDYIDRTTGWYRCIVATNPYYYASNNFSDTTKWVPSSKPFISWMYRSTAATYNFNNVVYYSGTWYRCKIASASSTPTTSSDWENVLANSGSWNWSSSASYYPGNVVYRSGSFYRCILAHSNQAPANATYWATAPLKSNAWDSNKSYSVNDTVSCNGIWYYTEL